MGRTALRTLASDQSVPAPQRDAPSLVRHVRVAGLGGSELTFVQTSPDAAPPDVRPLFEVILVDHADKRIVHRGTEQRIRSGMVGIRSPLEAGRLVRRDDPRTEVRILALGEREMTAALEAAGLRPRDFPSVLSYRHEPSLFKAAAAVFEAVDSEEAALEIETLVAGCAREAVATLVRPAGAGRTRTDRGSAERIRDVLRARVSDDFTLDELAREVSLSRAYVVRTFQRAFHLTPYEYLMQLRVARARTLLAKGDRPIDVAHACGFYDQSHLNRWFRKTVGVTPKEYGTGGTTISGGAREGCGRSCGRRNRS
jgi:AraC-like DNA-binding protein